MSASQLKALFDRLFPKVCAAREMLVSLPKRLRAIESQMLDLKLSHQEGTHREVYREIDELRARIEQLESGRAGEGDGNAARSQIR